VAHTINDVRPIVTRPLGMATPWSRNQWIQSPHIHTFDHKANMCSKLMAITPAHTGVPCHTMQIILFVFYIYVSFTSPTLLAYLAQYFFSKCQSSCATSITVRVVKYACFLGTQNRRAVHGKSIIDHYMS
jgi:hypothetical protein